ncbi:MAG: hypothetical protein ACPGLV_08595 [Bacteroidia bacterium]
MKFLTVLLILISGYSFANGQTPNAINLKKNNKDKIKQIELNSLVKLKTVSGERYGGKLTEITETHWLIDADTVFITSVDWIMQKTVWRPVGTVFATGGTTLFIFGTAGWASSVGSDETWVQLGAVVGALVAITGAAIDGVAIPMLLKGRKYRVQPDAKWQIIKG